MTRQSSRLVPRLVLVDGFNLLWRSAFGFPARITTRDGVDVTAPFGFFALLRKALREFSQPTECMVVFDSETGWFQREADYANYKAHRRNADFSPIDWLPNIEAGLTDLGVAWQESGYSEADDVIATLVASTRRRQVTIMSTDKDFYQLLTPRVTQLNTSRAAARRVIDALEVIERFQVTPAQWCDYVALVGDRSDGVLGVWGVGPKRAAAMLANGLHLEDLASAGRLTGAHGRRVSDQYDQVVATRALVRLRTDADLRIHPSGRVTPDLPLAARVLEEREIW